MEVSFLEEDTCTEVLRELVPPTRILSLASHGALVFEISHQKQEALDLRSSASTNISWHTVNMHCKEEKEVMPGRKTRNVSVLQETSMSTIMIVAGSSMGFLGGVLYQLSPVCPESSLHSFFALDEIWMTACLTLGVFIFCAAASCTRANRLAVYDRASPLFLRALLIPSALDILITMLSTIALAFAQPALVGILKAAVQLLSLSLAPLLIHCVRQTCVHTTPNLGACLMTIALAAPPILSNMGSLPASMPCTRYRRLTHSLHPPAKASQETTWMKGSPFAGLPQVYTNDVVGCPHFWCVCHHGKCSSEPIVYARAHGPST